MKKIISCILLLCILCSACSSEPTMPETSASTPVTITEETAQTTTPSTTDVTVPTVTYQAPMVALSVPPVTYEYANDDSVLIFSYTSQDFSLILPDPLVAEAIVVDYLNRVDFENSAAKDVYKSAQLNYNSENWSAYFYSELYSPVRLDQTVLSMYGAETVYDGSPRSTSINVALNYDLLTGVVLEEITQILVEDYSAETLCQLITDELFELGNQGLLFADYGYIISDMFNTNTPVTNWFFSETGLCFFFNPYEIAPFHAGTILVELPYSSLNGLIKDQYFPAEQADLYGSPILERQEDDNSFQQISELILNKDSDAFWIHTDGTLFNVQICQNFSEDSQDNKLAVFAAAALSAGDAIALHCEESALSRYDLVYRAGGETYTVSLADLLN